MNARLKRWSKTEGQITGLIFMWPFDMQLYDEPFEMKGSASLKIRFPNFVKMWSLTECDLFTTVFVKYSVTVAVS